ncbi:hypothetical protein V499_03659 [Pseudogymnoascus sp. VKM F-103]|nr:hypothetical protein V499_03659 [Pseudogymnoascus sp. VKM F-103]
MASFPPSGSVPATLTTIPIELLYQIITQLREYRYNEILPLRLVCRELNHHVTEYIGTGSYFFRQLCGEFMRADLHRMLAIAHFPVARRFVKDLLITMTKGNKGRKLLANERSPGWGRNALGHLASPEKVYEIRTLKAIMGMLQNCDGVRLTYNVEKKGQREGSIQQTVEGILVVCAAAEVNIRGAELCDHHIALSTFTIDQSPSFKPWDKTLPLLNAACAVIPALQLTISPANKETDWVEAFVLKCVNLEQLSVNYKACSYYSPGLHHRFYDDIAATTKPLPKVQALMIETNGFTLDQLTAWRGRVAEVLRVDKGESAAAREVRIQGSVPRGGVEGRGILLRLGAGRQGVDCRGVAGEEVGDVRAARWWDAGGRTFECVAL